MQSTPTRFRQGAAVMFSSLLLIIPAIWLPHIESADLPSHLYNAWLRMQVEAGTLSGFFVARRWTNFLVDDWLVFAMRHFGSLVAERSLAIGSVLVVFWGLFRFVSALSKRSAWALIPLFGMLSYGAVFRWGFFNFYVSFGLCLWSGALALSSRVSHRAFAAAVFCLALAAHPLSPLWLAVVVAYLYAFRAADTRKRAYLLGASVVLLITVELWVRHRFELVLPSLSPTHVGTWLRFAGVGQLTFYGPYTVVALLLIGSVLPLLWRARKQITLNLTLNEPALHLTSLSVLSAVLSPDLVTVPGFAAPFSVIQVRLSLMTATFACASLNRARVSKAYTLAWSAVAVLFFALVFRDELTANGYESQIAAVLTTLTPGARVIIPMRDSTHGVALFHLGDRACIGHCFDYGNYEASSGQFPLTAKHPNKYALAEVADAVAYDRGEYVIKPSDLPLIRVEVCPENTAHLCAIPVRSGDRIAIHSFSAVTSSSDH